MGRKYGSLAEEDGEEGGGREYKSCVGHEGENQRESDLHDGAAELAAQAFKPRIHPRALCGRVKVSVVHLCVQVR